LNSHVPVLLDRVLETLGDLRGKSIIDATFGAGGYSRAFLERGANVIAFDRDPSVAPFAEKLKQEFGSRFEFINAPFSHITHHISHITDVVFDLGVSSMQIDAPERGFSWRFDAPLDMRMFAGSGARGAEGGVSAAELIEKSSAGELAKILREYGDVKKAGVIARAIKNALPRTTFQLRELIYNPKDVAPVFQALRIAVNDELGEIRAALGAVPGLLAPGGICACVTFHSIEDRIVKNTFREWTTPAGDPRFPQVSAPFELLETFRPDKNATGINPRARSSHLRAARKTCNIIAQSQGV
jgi:16S rRNA (cytosine1402-N4)-methyltransferase